MVKDRQTGKHWQLKWYTVHSQYSAHNNQAREKEIHGLRNRDISAREDKTLIIRKCKSTNPNKGQ